MASAIAIATQRWWRRNPDGKELVLPATATPTTAQRKADVLEAIERAKQTELDREQALKEWDAIVEQRLEDVVHAKALMAESVMADLHDCSMSYRHLSDDAKKKRVPAGPEEFELPYKFED